MNWLIIAIPVLVVVAAGAGFLAYWSDLDWWGFPFLLLSIGAAVGAIVAVVIAICVPIERSHAEDVCERVAVQLERDTKFVSYSSFSWDCLTPSEGGWVSVDRVIKAEGGS